MITFKIYTLRIAATNKKIWQYIKDGKKKVETRAFTIKYQSFKEGDKVIFSCAGKKLKKSIKKVSHFKSIDALLKIYRPEEINPEVHTKEGIIAQYKSFPGYEDKIKEFGIIALELE